MKGEKSYLFRNIFRIKKMIDARAPWSECLAQFSRERRRISCLLFCQHYEIFTYSTFLWRKVRPEDTPGSKSVVYEEMYIFSPSVPFPLMQRFDLFWQFLSFSKENNIFWQYVFIYSNVWVLIKSNYPILYNHANLTNIHRRSSALCENYRDLKLCNETDQCQMFTTTDMYFLIFMYLISKHKFRMPINSWPYKVNEQARLIVSCQVWIR